MTLACVEVRDNKPKRSRDPGQTGKLHRGFRAAADMQLRGLRAALRQAIVDVNVLGLSGPSDFTFMAPETRLNQFAGWLETAANASLDARWWAHPWLHRAIQHGLTMAQAELGGKAYMASPASFETLHQLAHHELRGIIAALVQQVVRQAHRVTARRLVPHKAFRDLAKPIDKAIHNRLHAFVQVMTVKAHIHGKVAYYRQAGLTHVGINPELKNPKRIIKQRDRAMRDRDIESVAEAIWQTAEDEDVCDECEEMAAGSPYSIDEIEDLIPLHPGCRCDAVIWDDSDVNDSMTVVDGFDPDEPRDEHGRWTGEALNNDAEIWHHIDKADRALTGTEAHAVYSWVGGEPDAINSGIEFGVFSYAFLEAHKNAVQKTFQPIAEKLKAKYGNYLSLYRYERLSKQPKGRSLYSYTSDPNAAEFFSNAPKEQKLFTESDILKAEKEFAEKGSIKIGSKTLKKESSNFNGKNVEYIAIYNPAVGGFETDTESIREYMLGINADRSERNTIREKALLGVNKEKISIDNIIWATNRFGQKEFIVKIDKTED